MTISKQGFLADVARKSLTLEDAAAILEGVKDESYRRRMTEELQRADTIRILHPDGDEVSGKILIGIVMEAYSTSKDQGCTGSAALQLRIGPVSIPVLRAAEAHIQDLLEEAYAELIKQEVLEEAYTEPIRQEVLDVLDALDAQEILDALDALDE